MQLTGAGSWWPFSAARRAGLAPVDPDPNSTHYSGVILTRKEVQQGIPTGTQQIRDSRLPKSEKNIGPRVIIDTSLPVISFMLNLAHFNYLEPTRGTPGRPEFTTKAFR